MVSLYSGSDRTNQDPGLSLGDVGHGHTCTPLAEFQGLPAQSFSIDTNPAAQRGVMIDSGSHSWIQGEMAQRGVCLA